MLAAVTIRPAIPADRPHLRQAIVELQDYERVLHMTRLPGEAVADAYLDWLQRQADTAAGTVLVAESESAFVGFVVGAIRCPRGIGDYYRDAGLQPVWIHL